MQHVAYLTVYPGLILGERPDLYGGYDVINTSANVPSHILSIILYADRRVLQSGYSFKHIPVCQSKTVLQDALSLWGPELKGLVHPKMKILSLITHPHVVPNP